MQTSSNCLLLGGIEMENPTLKASHSASLGRTRPHRPFDSLLNLAIKQLIYLANYYNELSLIIPQNCGHIY